MKLVTRRNHSITYQNYIEEFCPRFAVLRWLSFLSAQMNIVKSSIEPIRSNEFYQMFDVMREIKEKKKEQSSHLQMKSL